MDLDYFPLKYLVTSDHANEATAFVDHDLWEKIV